jgi:hypothetical protein
VSFAAAERRHYSSHNLTRNPSVSDQDLDVRCSDHKDVRRGKTSIHDGGSVRHRLVDQSGLEWPPAAAALIMHAPCRG